MIFLAEPSPSGAAVRLTVALANEGHVPSVYASSNAAPPVLPISNQYRLVADGSSRWFRTASRIERENPAKVWLQILDIHPSLRASTPVYYHCLFTGAGAPAPLTVQVTPIRSVNTAAVVLRDVLRPRIEYALQQAIAANRFGPRVTSIPVYEQDSLAKDQPLPAVLVKESQTFVSQPIGGVRADWKRLVDGKMYRERSRTYRARLDLLVISENPSERTEIANVLQEMVQADWPLYEELGYREVSDQRMTRGGQDPEGLVIFAEEITLDGTIELVVREELLYSLADSGLETLMSVLRY